jgi:hypothetical protein
MAYQIKPLKSARDNIYKTKAQKAYIMPPPGTTVIVGSTGSGKTTIVGNLLSNKHMLKDYYDKIYVFCLSPCTTLIDNVEQIQEEDVFTDDNPDKLRELYEINKKSVKSVGFKRTKHVLFILDDIVQSNTFMNSKIMTDIFFGGTHAKCSLWLLSQNYMSVPRRLRMNCHALILCHGVNNTEIERFATEWQSAYLKKDEFIKLVEYCLDKPYSFMFVNATNPNKKEMYRCGFNSILVID